MPYTAAVEENTKFLTWFSMQACSRLRVAAGIVAVVLERLRHGLRHHGVRGEMHHRVDLVFRQQPRNQSEIADIADDEIAAR